MNLLTLFFVIDHSHSQKRIRAFQNNVENLTIVSYYRDNKVEYENHHNLGICPQKNYFLRFIKILFDIPRLIKILRNNPQIHTVYAWNYDIALLFVLSSKFLKQKYTFIYEVADVKPILLKKNLISRLLRWIEQYILNNTAFLCVTSEEFLKEYFNKYYNFSAKPVLLENKVYPAINPQNLEYNYNKINDHYKWKIGFLGLLRCEKSFSLLSQLVLRLPGKVEILLAGKPDASVEDTFNKLIQQNNVHYLGKYHYPDDLERIYSEIDVVWSVDLSDTGTKSEWLLPNRLYEAGVFQVPQLCFAENVAISNYLKSHNIGWCLDETNIEKLIHFFISLTVNQVKEIKENYKQLPYGQFSGDDQIKDLLISVQN